MYIIIVLSFLFYTYTYYYILLIMFSRDYLEIFGGRFGKIWIAPVIHVQSQDRMPHIEIGMPLNENYPRRKRKKSRKVKKH